MSELAKNDWWKRAIIYQVYPRSFQDSNDDGIGDLQGIIKHLDYLKQLGVDALWLSPVYTSPNKDFGYDIADYYSINPEYGTLDDMKQLINEANLRGMRIIMDLVINHTSDQHPWFQASRDPQSPYRDYYIWQKGRKNWLGKEKAPNNWTSFFTGPAWQKDDVSGEWYLHLFTKEQPDLNYRNPAVIEEVKKILTFWLDLGVDGFRCDVINILYKDSFENGKRRASAGGQEYYVATEGTHKILQELYRDVLEPRGAFTVGEAAFGTLEQAKLFTAGDELTTVFGFDHVVHEPSPKAARKRLKKATLRWQTELPWNTVFLENHDQPRSVSVFGNPKEKFHDASAKALATLLLTLRGTAFIYQGEELGMTDAPFTDISQAKDPVTTFIYRVARKNLLSKKAALRLAFTMGRDNARTPMQWNTNKDAGFTNGTVDPWLMVNPNYLTINAQIEDTDASSVLNYYRALAKVRRQHTALTEGAIEFYEDEKEIYAYHRSNELEDIIVFINLSERYIKALTPMPKDYEVLMATHEEIEAHGQLMAPFEARVLRYRRNDTAKPA